MTDCGLDHLVVTAPDLEMGVKFVSETLGVFLQVGGEHARMGTHNYLLKLGESLYLEVIAPDPNAPKPERSRWFDLDHQSPHTAPKLAAWVARTTDIHVTLAASTEPLGKIEPMSRGDLHWLITIPSDGSLPFNGIAPTLIQWQTQTHPAASLQDVGCSLIGLEGFHPQASRIRALLESIRFHGEVSVLLISTDETPFLVAHIQTPDGLRHLSAAV
jgi:hypothetical protein